MRIKKANSYNGQVYEKTCTRLNLTPAERNIFQRLLGFLIRNDKPFPYSAVSMKKITGYSLRTIFRAFDRLEYLRLIERIGMGKNRKFIPGTILSKIKTTVPYSIKIKQSINSTTVPLCHKNLSNRAMVAYRKTSLSLKRKEKGFSQEEIQQIWYYKNNPQIKIAERDRYLFDS